MAGILAHARGMIAVLAPLVNSYKRLVPGYEAPTYLTWGRTNRSALIRVPKVSPGIVASRRRASRCAARIRRRTPTSPSPCMLAAGLDGIEKGMELGDPVEESLYAMSAGAHQGARHPRAARHARRGDRRAGEGRGHPRRAGRPRAQPLRRGQARGVGRVPHPGHPVGDRALPGRLLGYRPAVPAAGQTNEGGGPASTAFSNSASLRRATSAPSWLELMDHVLAG